MIRIASTIVAALGPATAALDRHAEGQDAGPPEGLELRDRDAPLGVALDRPGRDRGGERARRGDRLGG